jgi:hypothetical protein
MEWGIRGREAHNAAGGRKKQVMMLPLPLFIILSPFLSLSISFLMPF